MFGPRTLTALILAMAGAGSLVACSTTQQAKVDAAVAGAEASVAHNGQLFCAVATKDGPLVVGIIQAGATAAGVAIPGAAAAQPLVVLATGAAKAFVDATCAAVGGLPVSPPANAATAPQVAVVVPAA